MHSVSTFVAQLLVLHVAGKRANLNYGERIPNEGDTGDKAGRQGSSTKAVHAHYAVQAGVQVEDGYSEQVSVAEGRTPLKSAAEIAQVNSTAVDTAEVSEVSNTTGHHTEEVQTYVTSLSQLKQELLNSNMSESRGMVDCLAKLALILSGILLALCSICGMKKVVKEFNMRSWCGIGELLRAAGIDKHETFHLSMIIDKVQYVEPISTAIRIHSSYHTVHTEMATSTAGFHQTLTVEVPQGTSEIVIELVDDFKKSGFLASKKISVDEVLRLAQEAEKTVVVLKRKKGKMTQDPQVFISFCADSDGEEDEVNLDGVNLGHLSPEMQMKLQQAKREQRRSKNKKKSEDDSGDDPEPSRASQSSDKLTLLSSTCSGPLSKHDKMARTSEYFFAVYQAGRDTAPHAYKAESKAAIVSWCLGWWKEKGDYDNKEKPVGCVSMLRVTNVYPVPDKPNVFCIRHVLKSRDKEDMFLSRVDRSRDVWVESVHLFIEQLRSSRQEFDQDEQSAEQSDGHGHSSDGHGHSGKHDSKHHHGRH